MIDQFIYAFGTMTALVLPLTELPIFLAIMSGRSGRDVARAAFTVAAGAFGILAGSTLAGQGILEAFGVSFPAFRTAGGLVLVVVGLEMLNGHSSAVTGDERGGEEPVDRLWMPLIMPLTAGPAAITGAIALAIRERDAVGLFPMATLLAVGASCILVYVTLLAARPIAKRISTRTTRLAERFLGLILVAVGFQMGMTGVAEFFHLGPGAA
jgi:multiple antibiotic resistance protein